MTLPSRILPLLLLFAFLPASSAAQHATGKPITQMPESARKLIGVTISGLKRFPQDEVITASGLQIGSSVIEDDFKKAARRLGDTGVFGDIEYSFSYSALGTKVEFKVTEATKFLPAHFEDFVWFSEYELRRTIKEHVPLFDGELPISGRMPDEVSDVLQAMLVQIGVPGHVNYIKYSQGSGPIESFNYSVADVSIRVRNVEFTGVGAAELPPLQDAAEHMSDREYSRTRMIGFVEHQLLPIFRGTGYLKATFSPPQPKVVKPAENAGDNNDAKNLTLVDVALTVDPGPQYKLSGVEWVGNHDIPTETLQTLVHAKVGKPADTVRLADDLASVRTLYGTKGHVTAAIKVEAHFDDAANTASLIINVKEEAVYHMGDLEFRGLDNALTAKLRAIWKLRPGDIYDASYLADFLPQANKLLPVNLDWKVDPHVTANLRDQSVDVDLQYSVSAPK
jgi:outer membrane protein assembly factor BamA